MTTEEKQRIASKFFQDPDWVLVEKMLNEYLDPLTAVANIDATLSNDAVAAEVRGRQLSIERLGKFLRDCGILRNQQRIINNSFK